MPQFANEKWQLKAAEFQRSVFEAHEEKRFANHPTSSYLPIYDENTPTHELKRRRGVASAERMLESDPQRKNYLKACVRAYDARLSVLRTARTTRLDTSYRISL